MGITVTTNLGLIKSDDDESIKANLPTFPGWVVQNGSNCDKLDGLFRASNTSAYTLGFAASSGGFTLGSGGFTEGKYLRLWPRMVIAYFRVFCGGAGFATGTGFYTLNLPTSLATELTAYGVEALPLGKGIFQDNSSVVTSSNFIINWLQSSNACIMRPSAGGLVAATSPVTLAQNDRFSGYMIYPTSDA